MTAPQDPFAPPGDDPQQPGGQQQPGDHPPPQYGQQPGGYPPPGYGQQPYGQKQGTSPLAIGALISAFLCSPLGIVLGLVAKSQIKKTGQAGNGLATAAIVVGVVSILLGVALFASGAYEPETSP